MKHLIKVIIIIASFFALSFIIGRTTGILNVEQIEVWFKQAQTLSPFYIGTLVVLLQWADLLIAVPTLTTTLFSGYFLGFIYGTIASLTGMMLTGISGYLLGYLLGEKLLRFLLKKEKSRQEAKNTFDKHGFIMILLSRAVPILPEITACLAGMTKMPFPGFLTAWSVSTIPYVIIASYAGSISSVQDPKPAIFTAIGISCILWIGWYIFKTKQKKQQVF